VVRVEVVGRVINTQKKTKEKKKKGAADLASL
jgi:hypothetical protein